MQFPLNAVSIECSFPCVKVGYSIEPRERRYVKGYRFLSFVENIGKNLSNRYRQNLVDSA